MASSVSPSLNRHVFRTWSRLSRRLRSCPNSFCSNTTARHARSARSASIGIGKILANIYRDLGSELGSVYPRTTGVSSVCLRAPTQIQNKHSPQGGACFPSVYFCFLIMSTIHACFIVLAPAHTMGLWSKDSPLISRYTFILMTCMRA